MTDGSGTGTARLGPADLQVQGGFVQFGDELVFDATEGSVASPWITDGTTAGTRPLQIPGVDAGTLTPLLDFRGRLLLVSSQPISNNEFVLTDGTSAGACIGGAISWSSRVE